MSSFKISFYYSIKSSFTAQDGAQMDNLSYYPTSSDNNLFVPYHALMSGRLLELNGEKSLLYNLNVNKLPYYVRNNYERFFYDLIASNHWSRISKRNTLERYFCRAGQLVEVTSDYKIIPLMTIAVAKEYTFNIDKANIDYSKFFIVIDKKFIDNRLLYKNFCEYYLKEASKYVDVIHTSSIRNLCYRQPNLVPIKPTTLSHSKELQQDMTYNIIDSLKLG